MFRFPMILIAVLFATAAIAQPAQQTPTAICKDGSNYFGSTKQGACSGHGGIKEWHGTTAPSAANPAAPTTSKPSQPSAATSATPQTSTGKSAATAGAAGQVWVNKSSKVYHCPGTQWYGKTKSGEYMSEAEAKAQGFHADHGKSCG
jgi:hypothetical protein